MTNKTNIQILMGVDNFLQWKSELKGYLKAKRLWDSHFVHNEHTLRPQQEGETEYQYGQYKTNFHIEKEKALGIIKSHISYSLKSIIEHLQDPKDALDKLEKQLMPSGLAKFLVPHNKLLSFTLQPDQDLQIYFGMISKTIDQIKANSIPLARPHQSINHHEIANAPCGTPGDIKAHYIKEAQRILDEEIKAYVEVSNKLVNSIFDKWTMTVMLRGLPPEYKVTEQIINAWGDDTTVEMVQAQLCQLLSS